MRLLKLTELEDFFAVSRTTIWNWRNNPDNNFPKPIKINNSVLRFDESEIIDWIRNRREN